MAKKNFTTSVKTSLEFVRRSPHGGLELVRTGNGIETTAPVQVTTHKEKQNGRERLVVGLAPAPILWTVQCKNQDQVRVLEVL